MAVRRTARHHCASIAVLNTNVSAATSFLTCTCLDVIFFGRPSVIGGAEHDGYVHCRACLYHRQCGSAAKLCGKKCPQNVDYTPELIMAIAFTFFSSLYI